MIFFVIAGLVMALGAILFAFPNSTVVTISFGVWQFQQSLAIVLLITLKLAKYGIEYPVKWGIE